MDAFSSDAVPAHLLTREALADADRALREDGILAVHVSNRYYGLGPPVGRRAGRAWSNCPRAAGIRPDSPGGRQGREPGPTSSWAHGVPEVLAGSAGPRLGSRPPRRGAADGRLPGPAPLPGSLRARAHGLPCAPAAPTGAWCNGLGTRARHSSWEEPSWWNKWSARSTSPSRREPVEAPSARDALQRGTQRAWPPRRA